MSKTVLLLHGVRSSRSTWWRAEQDLSDLGWTVHAIDLLGHGGRSRDGRPYSLDDLAGDVIDQVAQLGFLQHPLDLVVGHSLGAIVSLVVAAREPQFARRIVMEDPPGLTSVREPAIIADWLRDDVARAARDTPGEIAKTLAANPSWAPMDAEFSVLNTLGVDLDATAAFLRTERWDLPELVRACPIPLSLIAATPPGTSLDEPVRTAVMNHLRPDRISIIRSGHSVHRDRPALWLLAVLAEPGQPDLPRSSRAERQGLSPG